jgi:4'-phosphopantetheinyl transferase EntD
MPDPTDNLQALLPTEARGAFSSRRPDDFELLAGERDCAASMPDRRLRDFLNGRACARLALTRLGFADCPVPIGPDREPLWPDGVVGSISHCGEKAAAAVARVDEISGIGLDIELGDDLDEALVPMICRVEEQRHIASGDTRLRVAKLIFSAKESIFKCIWPSVRRFVDFQEVSVRLDLDRNVFRATARSTELPADLLESLRGRIGRADGLLVTAAFLA